MDTRRHGLLGPVLIALLLGALVLLPACDEDGSGEGADLPEGELIVQEKCADRCHSDAQIRTADYDRTGWEATVDRMIRKGADLTQEERETLVDYLSE